MTEMEKLLIAYDVAIQIREAALRGGPTNFTPEQAMKEVRDAREAILAYAGSRV